MVSGGFRPTYEAVLPGLTAATGHAARTLPSPSTGDTPGATQKRRCAADLGDVPIMAGSAPDGLIKQGLARPDTKAGCRLPAASRARPTSWPPPRSRLRRSR